MDLPFPATCACVSYPAPGNTAGSSTCSRTDVAAHHLRLVRVGQDADVVTGRIERGEGPGVKRHRFS